ncbi:MAG: TIGR04086 family membrane protein [Tissierella sp.]|uniref:TIGR04086 family membrane protein n=1 Tax=Tissierella sp. TaxID=41274 RepID=UPI003F9A630B
MKNKINFKTLIKCLTLSFIITVGMIFITSLLLQYTSLKETKLIIINNIIMIISIFIPSMFLSLKIKEKGWLNGLLLGIFYYIIFLLFNIVFLKESIIILFAITKLLLAGLVGSIGGIIGINLK